MMVDQNGSSRYGEKQLNSGYRFIFILKCTLVLHCLYCSKYFHTMACLVTQQPYEVGIVSSTLILQMRKLK